MYGKIIIFIANRHHIYFQPHVQKGSERHLGYYRMTQDDMELVIKDQPEIWDVTEKEESPKEDKEKKVEKEQEKEQAKEKDKGKVIVGENRSGTIELGSSSRKKERVAKPTYQVVLHDDDFNTIADRVCDSVSEPITTFTTTQEALKKTIEV